MTTEKIGSTPQAELARTGNRHWQRQQGLSRDGLFPPAVLRDPAEFPDLWRGRLIDRLPGARGPHPNRVAADVEQAILDHALANPCHGPMRVAQELILQGVRVSSGGVRGVWQRYGLLTKHERLLRLEKATAERKLTLSEDRVRLLERFSPEFRERHIEAPHTGAVQPSRRN